MGIYKMTCPTNTALLNSTTVTDFYHAFSFSTYSILCSYWSSRFLLLQLYSTSYYFWSGYLSESSLAWSNNDDDNTQNKEFLEKILCYINDKKNIVNSKGYLVPNNCEIESIILYVCAKKDYYSTNKACECYGAYIWPIDLREVSK